MADPFCRCLCGGNFAADGIISRGDGSITRQEFEEGLKKIQCIRSSVKVERKRTGWLRLRSGPIYIGALYIGSVSVGSLLYI